MIFFSNAKINIGLNIVGKRPDGFHNIETIFYPVPLKDIVEFTVLKGADKNIFTNTGIITDVPANENLLIKAYHLLKKDFDIPAINIHLHKIIPFGAGLGGGSSDASFMLKNLNEFFELNLSDKQLEKYASEIGSDCAFFIKNKAVFATGRGNIFSKAEVDLSNYYLVLIKVQINVSTKNAYQKVVPRISENRLNELIKLPLKKWKYYIKNDFEKAIFKLYPEIESVKDKMYKAGAVYSSMSGSGASVFGIFEKKVNGSKLFENYFCFETYFNMI